ncbi:MAG: ribose 5-phosphate isomerase A, partial [Candidatus Dadabacteria bacterium]|nr:ribose 5-phosphate isomerase A [Candidatus Dadabacteria bacterium]
DEIDSDFNLIKGGGGALLREKILAQNSERNIIVADESKLSKRLGERFPVPVEVLEFALEAEKGYLESLGGAARLRLTRNGSPFLTDQGNFIVDWGFGEISDPSFFADRLSKRAGIVEHGLFVGVASDIIIGFAGGVEHLVPGEAA